MLRFLIIKEFKQIFRSGFIPALAVLMPVAMLCVFPFAANQEVKGLKVSVVDNDKSTLSEKLIAKTAASVYFTINDMAVSYENAMQSIEKGSADVIMEIPSDFEKNIVRKEGTKIMLSANSVNGMKGALASNYLTNIINDFCTRENINFSSFDDIVSYSSFDVKPYYLFNPFLNYKVFMIPALMVMVLTLMCGFLPALNIVGEKEKGTIEQMNVTPVSRFSFILSKLIPYWIIGLFVFSVSLLLAFLIYSLAPAGNILTIYLFAIIYISVVSGLGLVISNYANTMQQAMFLMFFFMLVFILMSGLFTPVSSMPLWAQYITTLNPLKYFIEVMRGIYLKGNSLMSLSGNMLALIIFSVVLNLWAVYSYKKTN